MILSDKNMKCSTKEDALQRSRTPISLLNVYLKIISKALSEKLKKVLSNLISTQQTAYVKNRHIGERGRLISDIIEIARLKKLEVFLVTMVTEKALDSVDHNFLISTLEKYDFGKNFILWVEILVRDGNRVYNYKVFLTWERCPSR